MNYNALRNVPIDVQIKVRNKISKMDQSERDTQILRLYVFDGLTSKDIEKLHKFSSKRSKFIGCRQINNIVNTYFPELMKYRARPRTKKRVLASEDRNKEIAAKKELNWCNCWRCGKSGKVDMHHILPFSLGGTAEKENLMPLCEECHNSFTQYFRKNQKQIIERFKAMTEHEYTDDDIEEDDETGEWYE